MTTVASHPKAIGDRTEAHILAALVDAYPDVLLPWGENSRYDLVIDTGTDFIRVQCKTGRLRAGAISFRPYSSTYHHPTYAGRGKADFCQHDYRGEADVFGVYCRDTGGVYLVPVGEVGRAAVSLRVAPTRNNQRRGIRWAADYQVRPPG